MSRYAGALDDTIFWLGIEQRGWGLVLVPPGEQREVAEELARRVPGRPAVELNAHSTADWFVPTAVAAATTPPGAFVYLARDLDEQARVRVLQMLNGQRDRTSGHGVWVMIVSLTELENQVRRHAGDLASVFHHWERVAFVPRVLTQDEVIAARAELHKHYQRRFGRLDLRGLIRSEQEDVSFAVEEVFQPLEATGVYQGLRGRARYSPWTSHPPGMLSLVPDPNGGPTVVRRRHRLADHLAAVHPCAVLIVGTPGSGKSFFLRWCALVGSRDDRFLEVARPIPICVPLAAMRAASASPDLESYAIEVLLAEGLAIAHVVAREAEAGRVLFLLDGLDEVGTRRRELIENVAALVARYPRSQVIVTSRPAGLDGFELDAVQLEIEGLDGDAVRSLLAAWCELYERQRVGDDGTARGRAEGERLGDEVLASPMLSELARTPLLATIIAIVHRAGVRLPDHRVELYEHIVRILVERWNDLRSRDAAGMATPIRAPDAIRLLGPVAFAMVEAGREGAIDEESLRELIARQLARGTVRAVADADEAVAVFRNSLGLLVEQAPGIYGFLHKTLAEFLAAHDAVRTGSLEKLLRPASCFSPQWREVILLALGIVGTVQANDDRLRAAIERIVENAGAVRGVSTGDVPALLGGIVADDPALSPDLAGSLCAALVPAWFERSADGAPTADVLQLGSRILRGPWREALSKHLEARYGGGLGVPIASDAALARANNLLWLLHQAGVPLGRPLCESMVARLLGSYEGPMIWGIALRRGVEFVQADPDRVVTLALPSPSGIEELFQHGAGQLVHVDVFDDVGDKHGQYERGSLELRGVHVVVRTRFRAPDAVDLWFPTPDSSERRRALVPAVLAAWRALATQYPDGPQPPASFEDAVAKYGPAPAS